MIQYDCKTCNGACCRYVLIDIPYEPRTRDHFDEIIWYLYNENIKILKNGREWAIIVMGKCENLDDQNMCRIYDIRPDLCREYPEAQNDICHGTDLTKIGGIIFNSAEELLEYLVKNSKKSWAAELLDSTRKLKKK